MKKTFTTVKILTFVLLQGAFLKAQSPIDKTSYNLDGTISMITFKKGTSKTTVSRANKSNINSLNKILNLPNNIDLKLSKATFTGGKFETEYYKTYLNGILIEGGEYRVNYKENEIISIAGRTFSAVIGESSKQHIDEVKAFNLAKESVHAKFYMWENGFNLSNRIKYYKPKGELVYLPIEQADGNHSLILAYKFDIFAAKPLSRSYVYVDATTGLILKKNEIIKHSNSLHKHKNLSERKVEVESRKALNENDQTANADTRYSGRRTIDTELKDGQYILLDNSRGIKISTLNMNNGDLYSSETEVTEFTDDDNNWTAEEYHNEQKDDAALDAHWGLSKSLDYFKDTFNRNSFDDNGTEMTNLVHCDNKYENAAWIGDGYMIYGDGDVYFDALTSLDIVAHELGHGICETTAGLEYQRESGALNEGFSDIWAAIVEHKYAPEKEAFLLGEDVVINEPYYTRSMLNPKSVNHPNTYKGEFWRGTSVKDGCFVPDYDQNDYCGVHVNSGLLNYWFYLLVQGGSGTNDIQSAYDLQGIGWEKAAQIVYRLETAYLTPKSDYKNARDFGIQSTIDLFEENSEEAIAVQNAFYAVGLGGRYLEIPDITSPTTPTNLVASNVTGDAVDLTWEPSTDENGIWVYAIFQNGVEIAKTSNTTYRITGLSQATSYNYTVKAYDTYSNVSSDSNLVNIETTTQATACYGYSNNASVLSISNVKLENINNSSTKVIGYEDFAYLNTDLEVDTDYTLEITPLLEPLYAAHNLGYTIFLDKDNSGNLTEKIATIPASTGTETRSTTIKLPADTTLDIPLRLRIVQSLDFLQDAACVEYPNGQVEDYSITAKSKTLGVSDLLKGEEIKIYPIPVKETLNVILKDKNEFKYEILNITGGIIKSGTSKGQIDVNYIHAGTYILKVTQNGKITTQKFIKK